MEDAQKLLHSSFGKFVSSEKNGESINKNVSIYDALVKSEFEKAQLNEVADQLIQHLSSRQNISEEELREFISKALKDPKVLNQLISEQVKDKLRSLVTQFSNK